MSNFPNVIDDDSSILRVSDNITETGGQIINQMRDAIFAIENNIGSLAAGSVTSISNRLDASLNTDGTIKASALTSIGLATLPIVDNQVASNAGIKEYKIALDFSTANLHTLILSNSALLNSLTAFANVTFSNLGLHIGGSALLSDGITKGRHTLSQIDLNSVPNDTRDPTYNWTGLKNKTGAIRSATQAADALLQINNDLVDHENSIVGGHVASTITVDNSQFLEIPSTATDAQAVFNYLDQAETLNVGQHRATEHGNVVPRKSWAKEYNLNENNIVPTTDVITYLVHSPNVNNVDDISIGDDLIKFQPINTNFTFDAKFSLVKPGQIITVNYGNGISTTFPIDSIRYIPNTEYIVRINGTNLFDGYATAKIDLPQFDTNVGGVLAAAAANATTGGASGATAYSSNLSSIIIGSPRGATAIGFDLDLNQLNSTHYNLYLELYPTGNPADRVISLPVIDVTGNLGITPGKYNLDNIIESINSGFRTVGYNYRFIAFSYLGELGIMLADAVGGVSFAIISGDNSSGTFATGAYTNNIIGGATLDDFDAFGFGSTGANVASPAYQNTWNDQTSAQSPTKVISPLKNRNFIVNGQRRDEFIPTYLANSDGYWDGYISARNQVGGTTVEVTYDINLNLEAAGIKPGKTIVIQPKILFTDSLYSDVDYGRFFIKNVIFIPPCGNISASTQITVINGIHATGSGISASALPPLPVKIYFKDDSVSFDLENIIDQNTTATSYARFHEIYIDQNGHTFSHERARMPRQAEDANKLNTANFNIINVSPKLRGYGSTSPLLFNKFIRFFVNSYNTVTGEYDGYLAQIAGTNGAIRVGSTVTARKNIITRFYDETNIDYIDLKFEEISVLPGNNILSTQSARYVDIELFPSLQLDHQVMCIATCEVNWHPSTGQYIVRYVKDARQFGSVSEEDLTTSALNFLSASDSLVHENGVIRGFDLDSIASNQEIFFKGGIALVDGKVVTVNNMSVVIPFVYNSLLGIPAPSQVLTWTICVNKNNDLVPVLLTPFKTQIYVTLGGTTDPTINYYINSATLSEIINNKKDLTPIAIATVTVSSTSLKVNSVQDIRRFVISEGLNHSLTWTSDSTVLGHFNNFDALETWINNYDAGANNVQVKGTFNLIHPVDMRNFNKTVIFDGASAIFNILFSNGILAGSNVTLRNFTFTYTPTDVVYLATNNINSGSGCIYINPKTTVTGITIDNCNFFCSMSGTQRPPFIGIELNSGDVLDRVVIKSCSFNDITTISQTAIAIINLNDGIFADQPCVVSNCLIKDNTCANKQGIFVTSVGIGLFGLTYNRPGCFVYNTKIEHNNCDIIGYLVGSTKNTTVSLDGYVSSSGLLINDNTCNFITTAGSFGYGITLNAFKSINHGTGHVIIKNNLCKWIHVISQDYLGQNETSSIIIADNILEAYDPNYLATKVSYSYESNIAIALSSTPVQVTQADITGNQIKSFYDITIPTTYTYVYGIFAAQNANISNNNIKGVKSTGIGIAIFGQVPNFGITSIYSIKDNRIDPSGVFPFVYIDMAPLGDIAIGTTGGVIEGNYFVDASTGYTFASNFPASWVIKDNVGQALSVIATGDTGFLGLSANVAGNLPYVGPGTIPGPYALGGTPSIDVGAGITDDTVITTPDTRACAVTFVMDASNLNSFLWSIPLEQIVPYGAYITQVAVNVKSSTVMSGVANIAKLNVRIGNSPNFVTGNSLFANFGSASSPPQVNTAPYVANQVITVTLTAPYKQCQIVPSSINGRFPKLLFSIFSMDSGVGSIFIFSPVITYRW